MKFIFKNTQNEDRVSVLFFTEESAQLTKNEIEFTGNKFDHLLVRSGANKNYQIFYGLGKEAELTVVNLEKLGYKLYHYLKSLNLDKISLVFTKGFESKYILAIMNGLQLSDYDFDKYKTSLNKKTSSLSILVDCLSSNDIEKFKELELIKENVFYCRDLVNEPSNILTPANYANICKELSSLGIEVELINQGALEKLGMNAMLSVSCGSDNEPYLVVMKWNGLSNSETSPIAFVGKGVTFDSGGISLKPANSMLDMKTDMGGSAVVVALLKLLAQRKAKVNAVGVIPLVENMPSGHATKPGDIVKSLSGQTIEILNTDAEGRMILADALYYTISRFQPRTVIDLATLTGAVCAALGQDNAGLFTNNDALNDEICDVAHETGENCWRMPVDKLGSYYDKMIDSDFADIKNISGNRYGGAITAAQFLQRFINKHPKWAHLDIACVTNIEFPNFFVEKNATGFGVRLLNQLVKKYYEQ